MKAQCIMTNCRRSAAADEAFCSVHRRPEGPSLLERTRWYLADHLEAHEHSDGRELLNAVDAALSSSISNAEVVCGLPVTTWAVPALERAYQDVERLRERMAQPSESGIDESLRAVLSALETADQELESVAC